ncbi:hypothetical protein HON22_02995, partial [Candidatus Peregrinibacteria bacterium]|nr:hypothetical protein [Candidatus Peregrinibacteria bacterium]
HIVGNGKNGKNGNDISLSEDQRKSVKELTNNLVKLGDGKETGTASKIFRSNFGLRAQLAKRGFNLADVGQTKEDMLNKRRDVLENESLDKTEKRIKSGDVDDSHEKADGIDFMDAVEARENFGKSASEIGKTMDTLPESKEKTAVKEGLEKMQDALNAVGSGTITIAALSSQGLDASDAAEAMYVLRSEQDFLSTYKEDSDGDTKEGLKVHDRSGIFNDEQSQALEDHLTTRFGSEEKAKQIMDTMHLVAGTNRGMETLSKSKDELETALLSADKAHLLTTVDKSKDDELDVKAAEKAFESTKKEDIQNLDTKIEDTQKEVVSGKKKEKDLDEQLVTAGHEKGDINLELDAANQFLTDTDFESKPTDPRGGTFASILAFWENGGQASSGDGAVSDKTKVEAILKANKTTDAAKIKELTKSLSEEGKAALATIIAAPAKKEAADKKLIALNKEKTEQEKKTKALQTKVDSLTVQAAELKTSTIDTPKASDSAKLKQARQNVTDAKTKQEKNRKNKNESSLFATYMNTKVSSSKTDKAGNTVKTYKKHSAGDSLNRIAMRQKAKKAISATFQASSMTDGPEKTQALKDAGTLTKQLDENGGLSAENTKLQKEVQSLYKKGDKRSDEEKEKKPSQIDKASNKLTQASQSYAGQLAGRMEFAVSGSWGILDKILQDLKERREKKEEKKLIEKLSRMDMDADDFKEKNPNVSDNVIAKAKKKQAIRKVRQDSNSERKIMKAKRKADRQSKKNNMEKMDAFSKNEEMRLGTFDTIMHSNITLRKKFSLLKAKKNRLKATIAKFFSDRKTAKKTEKAATKRNFDNLLKTNTKESIEKMPNSPIKWKLLARKTAQAENLTGIMDILRNPRAKLMQQKLKSKKTTELSSMSKEDILSQPLSPILTQDVKQAAFDKHNKTIHINDVNEKAKSTQKVADMGFEETSTTQKILSALHLKSKSLRQEIG